MRRSFWDKRLPTLLGILLISITTLLIAFSTRLPQLFESEATGESKVEDVRISNQTATSLSISFLTKEEVAAQVRFGTDLSQLTTLFDDRDEIGNQPGRYRTHYFTVKNLSSSQRYIFTILANGITFDKERVGFSAQTANLETEASSIEPLRGTVLTQDSQEAKNVLVFAEIEGASVTSTVTKESGTFLIQLSQLSTADLTSSYTLRGDEIITINVFGNDGSHSFAKFRFNVHNNLPPITLGQDVDLEEEKATSGFTLDTSSEKGSSETILTPNDGDFVVDPRPVFRGKADPREKVEITIESENPVTVEVTTNAKGEWVYQPETTLSPGKHTVTARFFDGDKVSKVIQHEFEVFASGSQVAQSATSSPTPTRETTPTPIAVVTAGPIPQTGTTFPAIAVLAVASLLTVVGFFVFRMY